jgi:beta-glucuronidase
MATCPPLRNLQQLVCLALLLGTLGLGRVCAWEVAAPHPDAKRLAQQQAAQPPPTTTSWWPATSPHWPHWPSRRLQVLNGTWAFAFRPNNTFDVENPEEALRDISFTEVATVPGCFDVGPRQWVRGTAVYRATATVTPGAPLLLHFGAVSLWSAVLIDGRLVSVPNAGGYTPFWVGPLASNNRTEVEITVVADNRFEANRTVTQHESYGFYQFGGILRAVTLHELPRQVAFYLRRVETRVVDAASGVLNISAFVGQVRASGLLPPGVMLGLAWGSSATVTTHEVTLSPNGEAKLCGVVVPQPRRLWSPARPALHTLTLSMGSDSIQVRFGLRSVAVHVDGRHITLNGAKLQLLGFNRHEMHPKYGSGGLPVELLQEDMAIIKRSGANYIRGSHYLQDQRWLDLCDESGVLVWEEVTGWGNGVADFINPRFMEAELRTLHAMVDHSFNHACVIIFAFFNEGASHHPESTAACESSPCRFTMRHVVSICA